VAVDKAAAFADIEAEYVGFRDLVAYLPDDAFAETVCGEWDLARLLAHMAGWYREIAPAFARIAIGEPPFPPDNDYFSDPDGWNARFTAQPKPGTAALDDFDEAFHVYYAAAKALDDEHFGAEADGSPKPANQLLANGGAGHLTEHRPQVEAWLARR
jgi:hypothetical protein